VTLPDAKAIADADDLPADAVPDDIEENDED
jgi:hypothetical protein